MSWLASTPEQLPLQRYVATLRRQARIIVLAVLLGAAAAAAYVLLSPTRYSASSSILITPVPVEDAALGGISVLHDSSDPASTVETAASLVTTTEVADGVRRVLRSNQSPQELLGDVQANPVANSNVVAVTADASTPAQARRLVRAFVDTFAAQRTAAFDRQLSQLIATTQVLLAREAGDPTQSAALSSQLLQLQTLRGGADPEFQTLGNGPVQATQSSPKRSLAIVVGGFAGLFLGLSGAFGLELLDPRLRRIEQLRQLFRLPVLAQIPRDRRRFRKRRDVPLTPESLSPATLEAYRTLRATVNAKQGEPRIVVVTGTMAGDGKSTTALNLAASLASIGSRVILVEGDLQRPSLARALGVTPTVGLASVLEGESSLDAALMSINRSGYQLKALLSDRVFAEGMTDAFFLPGAARLAGEFRELADYTVIDSPPGVLIDSLHLAQLADDVILVARVGWTNLSQLREFGDRLSQHEIEPLGITVIGVSQRRGDYYYRPPPSRRQRMSLHRHNSASR